MGKGREGFLRFRLEQKVFIGQIQRLTFRATDWHEFSAMGKDFDEFFRMDGLLYFRFTCMYRKRHLDALIMSKSDHFGVQVDDPIFWLNDINAQ